jgi:predicted ATPase
MVGRTVTDHLFVITGGPGSGKSSLVEALTRSGLQHMPEAGRAIIQDQVSIGGNSLPWSDRQAFAELMLGWELRSHHEASAISGPVICDRGVPDVVGYLTLCGLPVPAHVKRAAELFRYNRTVFIAPHWPAIFSQDAQRKQSEAEAAATYGVMADTYSGLGYDLVPLPLVSVDERVAFVRARIANGNGLL